MHFFHVTSQYLYNKMKSVCVFPPSWHNWFYLTSHQASENIDLSDEGKVHPTWPSGMEFYPADYLVSTSLDMLWGIPGNYHLPGSYIMRGNRG